MASPLHNHHPDGRSHVNPRVRAFLRPASKLLVHTGLKVQVEGLEKLPKDGAHVICPTHQSAWDPPLMSVLAEHPDLRFMAAHDQFTGLKGLLIREMGAFPVDRDKPSLTTIRHSIELLGEGKGLVIFPEGGIFGQDGKVAPLKEGAASIAVRGKAETVVPVTIQFDPPAPRGAGARLLALAAGAGAAAAGVAGAVGGPVARTVAGVVTGALTVAWAAARVGRSRAENEPWNPFPKITAGVLWGAGGLAVGAAAGLAASFLPGSGALLATSASAGLAVHAAVRGLQNRTVARVAVGTPLKVDAYVKAHGRKAAPEALTRDLHATLSATRARLLGLPAPAPAPPAPTPAPPAPAAEGPARESPPAA